MRLEDYTTLSCLTPLDEIRSWSDSDTPLARRGVSLEWLVTFVNSLQNESQAPRAVALKEAKRAYYHNEAADRGFNDQPYMPIPDIPPPSLMNVHCFVECFVKPLTEDIKAPLYARIPDQHLGTPEIFISHGWNSLLVGPEHQKIGTIDALAKPFRKPRPTYIWIDFICYNQHRFETIAADMEQVIGEIGRIAFAATPVPLLNRSWCLWELLCSERTGNSPEIFVYPGYRNDKILSVNALFRSFAGVERSRSSSSRDQADIFEAFRKRFGTFDLANAHIESLIREKLRPDWFELHERDVDLEFRPYPWIYDKGSDEARRAVGIEKWNTFDPYYEPALRKGILLGSKVRVFDTLIGAGMHVSESDRTRYELENPSRTVVDAFQAAEIGATAVLRRLFAAGFDVNTRHLGMDMLGIAAAHGHLEAARVILDAGADPNSVGAVIAPPLRIAAEKGHLDVVRLLVDRGAKVDGLASDGGTALLWAADTGCTEIVAYLLGVGANPNIAAAERMRTPLHMAVASGHADVVALLLDAGGTVSPKAFNGATPLHYAVINGHAAVAKLLLDHGANTRVGPKGVSLKELAQEAGIPEDILRRFE